MKRTLVWSLAILTLIATSASTATAGNWDDPFFDHPWSTHHRVQRSFIDESEPRAPFDFTVLGGAQVLRRNGPALNDNVFSVPTSALIGLQVNPNLALEGEFTLSVPLLQNITVADNVVAQRKGPDLLLYQAGVRVAAPGETYLLYVAAGGGMASFLVNAEPTRYPQISRVENVPAFNAGAGAMFYVSPAWSVRVDFRQFALLPPSDSSELFPDGHASRLWLQRAAIGLTYGHQPRLVREVREPVFHSSW